MADVALLGTGRMGAAMARRLAAGGHVVRVWNRTGQTARDLAASTPGITAHSSPAGAVERADAVLAMLSDGSATRDVLLDSATIARLPEAAVVVDLGTSGVDVARAVGTALSSAGRRFVDAPVSGSVQAVEAGTLLVMAAGDPVDVTSVEPILLGFARLVLRVGQLGAGQAMKLAVNLVVHDLNAAVSESLRLAESSGIEREAAYGVLLESVVAAPFVTYKRSAFLDPTTPVAMSLALVEKDLRLITQQGERLGVDLPVTMQAMASVGRVVGGGWGHHDMADLSRFSPDQAEA